MLQVHVHAPDDVRVDEVAAPTPGPNDVTIDIAYSGICGTDLAYITAGKGTSRPNSPLPFPLGHEAAGVVHSVGADVSGINAGMRVAINPMSVPTVIGNGASEGTLTTRLLLRDAVLNDGVVEVAPEVPLDLAALAEPLAVALRGIKRSQARPGAKVCVLGVGPIGLGAVIWLRHFGVTDIAAIDLSPARVQLADDLGARTTRLGGDRGALESLLASAHGLCDDDRGHAVDTDVFIDCSGSAALVDEAVTIAKEGVRFALIGLHHRPVALRLNRVVLRELTIVGSRGYPDEFNEVVAALPALGPRLNRLVTHRYQLADFADAVDAARSNTSGKVLLEIDPEINPEIAREES